VSPVGLIFLKAADQPGIVKRERSSTDRGA
jgi:hypothetical protein